MDHGIHLIDTGYGDRPAFCAAYLVVQGGRGAFVDCGTNASTPGLLEALETAGLDRGDVDAVILTHVHLDHAGGAGRLMGALPNARLVVHPRGAPHMADPAKLSASARAVYGDALFARDHGDGLLPVPAARIDAVEDGAIIDIGGRPLRCVDTPGHARHHLAVWDEATSAWFTGDVFGISYRELDTAQGAFAIPTTSPVQFDPVEMQDSVRRILAVEPAAAWLTHYGRVDDVARVGRELIEQVDAMVSLAEAAQGQGDRHAALVASLSGYYVERAERHGVADAARVVPELLAMDIQLNAQGLQVWLDRQAR